MEQRKGGLPAEPATPHAAPSSSSGASAKSASGPCELPEYLRFPYAVDSSSECGGLPPCVVDIFAAASPPEQLAAGKGGQLEDGGDMTSDEHAYRLSAVTPFAMAPSLNGWSSSSSSSRGNHHHRGGGGGGGAGGAGGLGFSGCGQPAADDGHFGGCSAAYMRQYFAYLWEADDKADHRPNRNRRRKPQDHVTVDMRHCLVDWLVDICDEFKLSNSSLFLCVNLLDRVLDVLEVRRERLQLLGCVVSSSRSRSINTNRDSMRSLARLLAFLL